MSLQSFITENFFTNWKLTMEKKEEIKKNMGVQWKYRSDTNFLKKALNFLFPES